MKNFLKIFVFLLCFSFFGCLGIIDESLISSVSFEITIPESIEKQSSSARTATTDNLKLRVDALHSAVTAVTERRGMLPLWESCSATAASSGKKSSGITLCRVVKISSRVRGRNTWEMLRRSIRKGTADKRRKKEDPAEKSRI